MLLALHDRRLRLPRRAAARRPEAAGRADQRARRAACRRVSAFASPRACRVTAFDLGDLFLFGVTTITLAFALFMEGAKHVPSAEASLIAMLDVVMGPLWVLARVRRKPEPRDADRRRASCSRRRSGGSRRNSADAAPTSRRRRRYGREE